MDKTTKQDNDPSSQDEKELKKYRKKLNSSIRLAVKKIDSTLKSHIELIKNYASGDIDTNKYHTPNCRHEHQGNSFEVKGQTFILSAIQENSSGYQVLVLPAVLRSKPDMRKAVQEKVFKYLGVRKSSKNYEDNELQLSITEYDITWYDLPIDPFTDHTKAAKPEEVRTVIQYKRISGTARNSVVDGTNGTNSIFDDDECYEKGNTTNNGNKMTSKNENPDNDSDDENKYNNDLIGVKNDPFNEICNTDNDKIEDNYNIVSEKTGLLNVGNEDAIFGDTKDGKHANDSFSAERRKAIDWMYDDMVHFTKFHNWLKMHYPSYADKRLSHEQKKYRLYLRELLWILGEQLRHCPQMLNRWFFRVLKRTENSVGTESARKVLKKLTKTDLRTGAYMQILEHWSQKTGGRIQPEPDPDKGESEKLPEFNFDDVDDNGANNVSDLKINPTFHEPSGGLVYLMIAYFMSDVCIFKLWSISGLFFLYIFDWSNPTNPKFLNKSISFTTMFALIDSGCMVAIFLLEYVLRLGLNGFSSMHCKLICKKNLSHFLFRWIFQYVLPFAFLPIFFIAPPNLVSFYEWMDWGVLYIVGRLIFFIIQEIVNVIVDLRRKVKGNDTTSVHRHRFLFLTILAALCFTFEYFFVIPFLNDLFFQSRCGKRGLTTVTLFEVETNLDFFTDSQQLVCALSFVSMWLSLILAAIIDQGLAFVIATSITIWIFGRSSARSETKSSHKLGLVFLDISYRFNISLVAAIELWNTSVDYWRKIDLINNKEQSYLKTGEENDKVIYTYKLLSRNAKAHVSVWLSTLSVQPCDTLPFNRIPTSTIMTPVYSETLEFTWDKKEFFYLKEIYHAEWESFCERINQQPKTFLVDGETVDAYKEYYEGWLDKKGAHYLDYGNIEKKTSWIDNVTNRKNKYTDHERIAVEVTLWATRRDQYVYKTIEGACSYWKALTNLQHAEYISNLTVKEYDNWCHLRRLHLYKSFPKKSIPKDMLIDAAEYKKWYTRHHEFQKKSAAKVQVVACLQTYKPVEEPPRLKEPYKSEIYLKKFPILEIVYDGKDKPDDHHFTGKLKANYTKHPHPPQSTAQDKPVNHFYYKSNNNSINEERVYRNYELVMKNLGDDRIQGKSMNQVNGLTFVRGLFVQVLDCNQGCHMTEYLKFPSLLKAFKYEAESNQKISSPYPFQIPHNIIIGAREYIFTSVLTLVGKIHGYQEWVFGTAIQRVYARLGVRLHYGHPDVFYAPWATGFLGINKVNPTINVSEDVFAGLKAIMEDKSSLHVEHIQFEKGRETGIDSLTVFDGKTSGGNPSLMRSRDLFRVMEVLPSVPRMLLYYGLCGHYITASLMTVSIRMYLISLFLISYSGVSLHSLGSSALSTEWLVHAGLATVIPLLVEFIVEHSVLGAIQALLFLPSSTLAYLFQLQTKHYWFTRAATLGKAEYRSSGRGLKIHRNSLQQLYSDFGTSHIVPMFEIFALVLAYQLLASNLGGGVLPLIMIYVFVFGVMLTPQFYNPTLSGSTLSDLFRDYQQFLVWIGNSSGQLGDVPNSEAASLSDKLKKEELAAWMCANPVLEILIGGTQVILLLIILCFFVYVDMQFWIVFAIAVWSLYTVLMLTPRMFKRCDQENKILERGQQTLKLVALVIAITAGIILLVLPNLASGNPSITVLYVSVYFLSLFLGSLRHVGIAVAAFAADRAYGGKVKAKPELTEKIIKIQKHVSKSIKLLNEVFLFGIAHKTLAFIWGTCAFVLSLFLRPLFWNFFLFGVKPNKGIPPPPKVQQEQPGTTIPSTTTPTTTTSTTTTSTTTSTTTTSTTTSTTTTSTNTTPTNTTPTTTTPTTTIPTTTTPTTTTPTTTTPTTTTPTNTTPTTTTPTNTTPTTPITPQQPPQQSLLGPIITNNNNGTPQQ